MAEQLQGYETAAQEGWDAMARLKPAVPADGRRARAMRRGQGAGAGGTRSGARTQLDEIGALLAVSESEQLEDLEAMAPAMLALVQLTEDFTAAYQAEKVRRNCMDFSDQEHYAIRLLQGDDGAPTPLGRQLSGRYREIMVDEYQDTNEVQNCIFRAISRDGQNLFTVGDVKQSIYRFRLADPTIFLEKYLRLPTGRGGRGGAATKGAAEPELPLPAAGAFGCQLCVWQHHVPADGRDGLRAGGTTELRGHRLSGAQRHGYGVPSDQRGG